MRAFHSFWSLPNRCRGNGEIRYPDFELLTTILSALTWKRHNGPISLITDTPGAEYFDSIGLLSLWDEVHTSLDAIDNSVDPFLFWAAGKLFALKQMEVPCVMLDTDLIVWETISFPKSPDLIAAHYEELYPEVYPDPAGFVLLDGYCYPREWDFQVKPANTAFLYIADDNFRDAYVNESVSFLRHVSFEGMNPITAMCFAEQRILPMCAKAQGKEIGYLIDIAEPNNQGIVTHTWGYKDVMRASEEERTAFCMRCVRRILKDYPEQENFLTGREDLKAYLEQALCG